MEKCYLLAGTNNKQLSPSSYKLATLDEALTVCKGKIKVFLYCDSFILDKVYNSVLSKEALGNIIFCSNMKNTDFIKWANGKEKKPTIMAYHKSNVIFAAVNQLNIAKKNNLEYIQYATNNQYGVIFSHLFMSKTTAVNTYFSFTNDKACGKRPDNVESWEDVLARGYNIIESNNCEEISAYFKLLEKDRQLLLQTISEYEKIDTKAYSFVTVKKLTEAYEAADQLLRSGTGNVSNLSIANTTLKNAISGLETDGNAIPTGKFVITGMRVFWMIFALLLFVCVNIYIYRKTKKQ
ncbi:hypothetical protein SDC9_139334 [bioreactor metagenome]|uniref:Uncharacterized protein n=1 Tax=bioreactor metagenome TaxID=1076179 RepID=A0A645DSE8_9ZZZZ